MDVIPYSRQRAVISRLLQIVPGLTFRAQSHKDTEDLLISFEEIDSKNQACPENNSTEEHSKGKVVAELFDRSPLRGRVKLQGIPICDVELDVDGFLSSHCRRLMTSRHVAPLDGTQSPSPDPGTIDKATSQIIPAGSRTRDSADTSSICLDTATCTTFTRDVAAEHRGKAIPSIPSPYCSSEGSVRAEFQANMNPMTDGNTLDAHQSGAPWACAHSVHARDSGHLRLLSVVHARVHHVPALLVHHSLGDNMDHALRRFQRLRASRILAEQQIDAMDQVLKMADRVMGALIGRGTCGSHSERACELMRQVIERRSWYGNIRRQAEDFLNDTLSDGDEWERLSGQVGTYISQGCVQEVQIDELPASFDYSALDVRGSRFATELEGMYDLEILALQPELDRDQGHTPAMEELERPSRAKAGSDDRKRISILRDFEKIDQQYKDMLTETKMWIERKEYVDWREEEEAIFNREMLANARQAGGVSSHPECAQRTAFTQSPSAPIEASTCVHDGVAAEHAQNNERVFTANAASAADILLTENLSAGTEPTASTKPGEVHLPSGDASQVRCGAYCHNVGIFKSLDPRGYHLDPVKAAAARADYAQDYDAFWTVQVQQLRRERQRLHREYQDLCRANIDDGIALDQGDQILLQAMNEDPLDLCSETPALEYFTRKESLRKAGDIEKWLT